MTIMDKIYEKTLSRRVFSKWLMKAASASALFAVFGQGIFGRSKAMAAGSAAQKGASTGRSSITVSGNNKFRTLLKNGLIVDGTGKRAYPGDLLINRDKIEMVTPGQIEFKGETIDCSDKVVAPGIIDMHSHMDWVLPAKGRHDLTTPFTRQGVTTFFGGNCGFGVAGFKRNSPHRSMLEKRTRGLFSLEWDTMAEYNETMKRQGVSHNLLNLVGYGMTRASIQGFDATPMKGEKMREQLYLLEEAMDQGARGVSLGLQYEPGVFATLDELKQVAQLVKRKDGIITVHMKAYSSLSGTYPLEFFGTPHNLLAIEDMLTLARETGVKMQLSHLIFVGERTWKSYEKGFDLIDQAIGEGLDVKFDTYAYHCGVSIINVVLPEWFLAGIPEVFESRTSLLKLRAELTLIKNLLGFGYEDIQITKANHPELEQYNGMFLKDIAIKRDMGEFENFIDFVQKSKGRAAVLNHRYSNLEQVKAMIKHPASLFQTDATVLTHGTQNPAAFGNFPRILQYAREFGLLSLEEVVHKMTGASAERFDLKDRGVLANGKAADIMVFDWKTVRDNNTDVKTGETPTGIESVFINGRPVLQDGRMDTSVAPGVVL
ncbi:MAG: amidohydrolase family protein [Proteobacteria bacterium]|nr:amidohydrolase family protein [Pseudomonadota bacterium]